MTAAAEIYAHAAAQPDGTPVRYTFEKHGHAVELTVPTMRFAPSDYWWTAGLLTMNGWLYFAAATLVFFLQPHTRAASVFFTMGTTLAVYALTALALYQPMARWVTVLHFTAQAFFPATLAHLAATFPVERRLIVAHPRLLLVPYAIAAVLSLASVAGFYAEPPDGVSDLAKLVAPRRRRHNARVGRGAVPQSVPAGYHHLRVEWGKAVGEALVISAPNRSWRDDRADITRWGVFCPVYSIKSNGAVGVRRPDGPAAPARWTAGFGGKVVGTLPLMAVYLDEPFDPSPYSPVSRVFWNESFIDPEATAEWASCPAAQKKKDSPAFQREMASLDGAELVQYRRQATLRRSVMEPLAERFFASGGPTSEAYRSFVRENPMAPSTCGASRDGGAKRRRSSRSGRNGPAPGSSSRAMWTRRLSGTTCTRSSVSSVSSARITDRMREGGGIVYLDLPVGVRGNGFDVWKNPGLFASAAMVVCCWTRTSPRVRSGASRRCAGRDGGDGVCVHDRFGASLHAVERCAATRSRDGLHGVGIRGMEPKDGAYVGYPEEPLWAILRLESHRNQCRLVGENLGTVPPAVDRATKRHGIGSLYVAEYEAQPKVTACCGRCPGRWWRA